CIERYRRIFLIGFSAGGNMVLKFLGEEGETVCEWCHGGFVVSAPCCLEDCADRLAEWRNVFYMRYFLRDLRPKMIEKARRFPDLISTEGIECIRTFHEFDARYTAPLFGFNDAKDFWNTASSLSELSNIAIPTLMLSAQDDSFLGPNCFPYAIAENHRYLFL